MLNSFATNRSQKREKRFITYVVLMPALANMILAALLDTVLAFVSWKYTTSRMPDWMMTLAHSLHGKSVA